MRGFLHAKARKTQLALVSLFIVNYRLFYQDAGDIRIYFFCVLLFFHSPHSSPLPTVVDPSPISCFFDFPTLRNMVMQIWIICQWESGRIIPFFHFLQTKLYEKGSMSANTISALSFLCTGRCFGFSFVFLLSKNPLFVLIVLSV